LTALALTRVVEEADFTNHLIRPFIPEPIIGGKCWVPDAFGKFLLQEGPGILRCIAITHTGSGALTLYDGVRFHYHKLQAFTKFRANPTVLGHFMLDAGFNDGLILELEGSRSLPCASIVWVPKRKNG
jgi:hypothetical protein